MTERYTDRRYSRRCIRVKKPMRFERACRDNRTKFRAGVCIGEEKERDWMMRLVDVHPDGYSALLAEGVMRARYRDPKRAGA